MDPFGEGGGVGVRCGPLTWEWTHGMLRNVMEGCDGSDGKGAGGVMLGRLEGEEVVGADREVRTFLLFVSVAITFGMRSLILWTKPSQLRGTCRTSLGRPQGGRSPSHVRSAPLMLAERRNAGT